MHFENLQVIDNSILNLSAFTKKTKIKSRVKEEKKMEENLIGCKDLYGIYHLVWRVKY